MTSRALSHLLRTLAEHDVDLGSDDVAWAFRSPQTRDDVTAWVNEYLNPATLLSKEEADLYSALVRQQSPHINNDSLNSSRGSLVFDGDLEAAVAALENSTASIEKQCAMLEAQKQALEQLRSRNRNGVRTGRSNEGRSHYKTELDLETNELTESLGQRITTIRDQTQTELSVLKPTVQRQLEADDRHLERLQKVLPELENLQVEKGKPEEATALSRALITLRSEATKQRINKVYLKATEALSHNDSNREPVEPPASSELADELDSLVAEIDSVLEMVVDHEYRRPILTSISRSEAEMRSRQKQLLSYVAATLQHMTDRLNKLRERAEDMQAYDAAIGTISQAYSEACPDSETTRSKAPAIKPETQRTPKGLKPLKLSRNDPTDPAIAILRQHDIRFTQELADDPLKLRRHLDEVIKEHKTRVSALSKSTEQTVSREIAESTISANGALQDLVDALYAYSPYGTVNLSDESLTRKLKQLEDDVEGVSKQMTGLDTRRLVAAAKAKQEDLLQDRSHEG